MTLEEYRAQKKNVNRNPNAKAAEETVKVSISKVFCETHTVFRRRKKSMRSNARVALRAWSPLISARRLWSLLVEVIDVIVA